jgi:histidyl-tRNA synthetase
MGYLSRMTARVEPRLFQGTRDVLPEELGPRLALQATLSRIFESYGFAPLETPAIEYLDILLGKYGPEGEKLIYKLAYKGGETLALRYDLTVPVSRVVAMHPDLPLPFKRYQIQPVWRADSPQPAQGRYREFVQCDVDTVGSASILADAENLAVVHDGIAACGLEDFLVRVNHRRLLRGLIAKSGLPDAREAEVLRIVDKLDKIGEDGVREELARAGIPVPGTGRLLELMARDGSPDLVLASLGRELAGDVEAEAGLSDLRRLLEGARALGVREDRLVLDLHLTRGLDYYTGPVYEVTLTGSERFGSLGGGGRYDDLLSLYGGASIPATGVSIGLSRLLAALQKRGLAQGRPSPAQVLVARVGELDLTEVLRLAGELRRAGVAAEATLEPERVRKSFERALKKGIPVAALLGEDELRAGAVAIRNLARGEQVTVSRAEAPGRIRAWAQPGG